MLLLLLKEDVRKGREYFKPRKCWDSRDGGLGCSGMDIKFRVLQRGHWSAAHL